MDGNTPAYIKRIALNDVTSGKDETVATVLTLDQPPRTAEVSAADEQPPRELSEPTMGAEGRALIDTTGQSRLARTLLDGLREPVRRHDLQLLTLRDHISSIASQGQARYDKAITRSRSRNRTNSWHQY
jgi:hypothetical protein